MENKTEKKPMPKWLVYTLFIAKFVFSLALIWWTIYMTLQSDVGQDADNAFLSTHKEMDDKYNTIIDQNREFSAKYNVKFVFNNQEIFGLTHQDVYLSQRVIQDRKIRKDMVNVGENIFSVYIQDKDGNQIKNKTIDILVTKNTTHAEDVKLHFKNEDTQNFTINSIGYWNITGTIDVNGSKGYFYIKTNAKKDTK